MNITQNQIEALIDEQGNARKCLKCQNRQVVAQFNMNRSFKRMITCPDCQGTGKATIEIEKEWVENKIKFKTINEQDRAGVEKITKYKVGDEINAYPRGKVNPLKLKIISETEKEWKVCLI